MFGSTCWIQPKIMARLDAIKDSASYPTYTVYIYFACNFSLFKQKKTIQRVSWKYIFKFKSCFFRILKRCQQYTSDQLLKIDIQDQFDDSTDE